MHIVHICLHFNTKIEYQELALAREQIRTGHKVTVVTSEWHPNFINYESIYRPILGQRFIGTGVFLEEGITIYRLKLLNRPSIFRRLLGAGKVLNSISPDLVICHSFEIGLLLFQATRGMCKVIVDSHQMPLHSRDLNWIAKVKLKMNDHFSKMKGLFTLLNKNIICVGVTEDSVEYLYNSFCPKSRVHLIPLAADTKCYFPDSTIRESMRKEFNFREDDVVLIFTGKIQKNKGVHHILESMDCLLSEGLNKLHLLLIGSGPGNYMNDLYALIHEKELGEKVNFINFTDKVTLNRYFNTADIAVYPKEVTISHLEAMAVGLPIIVEKLNGIRHRIKLNNGFAISNCQELTGKLRELSIGRELRLNMGKQSLRLVVEQFNWISINQQFMRL